MMLARKLAAVVVVVALIAVLIGFRQLVEYLDASQVMVVQTVSGDLVVYTEPGYKWQGMGTVTKYPRRSIYEISTPVRFNDAGTGTIIGSIQYEMPLDTETLIQLHKRFGSSEAIQRQLVKTVVDKSVYMTGPLMSSKESYAERRNQLIAYVQDQVANGVYRTKQRDTRITDELTGAEKTVTEVTLVKDESAPLGIARQEPPVLTPFGITPFNFSITSLPYDDAVEKQIKRQQEITMDVQTAIADARKSEQEKLTVEAKGAAEAAKAKWEQEAVKAREVTKAEQEKKVAELAAEKLLAVAMLDAQSAAQYKAAQIARGEGDAAYKQKVMEADGALAQKLEAIMKINEAYARAFSNYSGNWVPQVVMGGSGSGQGAGVADLVSLMLAKTAKELSVDMQTTVAARPAPTR